MRARARLRFRFRARFRSLEDEARTTKPDPRPSDGLRSTVSLRQLISLIPLGILCRASLTRQPGRATLDGNGGGWIMNPRSLAIPLVLLGAITAAWAAGKAGDAALGTPTSTRRAG
jgi:hypothetical protein